jgi:hypothetical protein
MVRRNTFGVIVATGLAVLAVVAFSTTTDGFHITKVHASSSLGGKIMSDKVILLRMPVTHHTHPILAAALLVAALAVAGLTVWWARSNPREAA